MPSTTAGDGLTLWWIAGMAGVVWDGNAAGSFGPFAASIYRSIYRDTWWVAPLGVLVGGLGVAYSGIGIPVRLLGILGAGLALVGFWQFPRREDHFRGRVSRSRKTITDRRRRVRMSFVGAGFGCLTAALVVGLLGMH